MNFKRVYREFKENLIKNITFILLITLSVMIIVGFNRAMDSYIGSVKTFYQTHRVEDGEFRILGSLTKKQKRSMENRLGVVIEENKTIDDHLDKNQKDKKERNLRIFSAQRAINQLAIIQGNRLKNKDEVVLDPKFAKENNYNIGDTINLRNSTFTIVGYGISPDYVYTLKNPADFLNAPKYFGVAYVTREGFEKIDTNEVKSTLYSYKKTGTSIDSLKEYLTDHTIVLDFIEKDDNSRIQTVFDDANGPKQMALVVGVLLIIIIAFIISISIQNTLKSESQTIGILYAQGFNKKELLKYYILLPSLLVFISSILGYGGGILISRPLLLLQEGQYTAPNTLLKDSWYLIAIGIVLPIVITLLITYFYLSKALDKTPLSLLRGDHSNKKVSKLEKILTFKSLKFFPRFRLKDMLRERGSMGALLIGILLSMMILSASAYIKDSCNLYVESLMENVPFNYVYTFTDIKDLYKYSKRGELTTIKQIKAIIGQEKKTFTLQGIQPKSTFFKTPSIDNLKENEVLITPSALTKFNLHIGAKLTLHDDLENKYYEVIIKGISQYDYGQYLYTNIYTFNKLFNIHKHSYNALMTDQSLKIPEEKVNGLTNKNEMISGVTNLLSMINALSGIMLMASICIMMTIIYLLMNMIINKSKINISMVKIFGYSQNEVSKMYIRGTVVVLIIGFVGGLPLGYFITKMLYDGIMANMQQYISPQVKPISIAMGFILMLLSYLVTCRLLKKNLDKVPLTEALKNRE